MERRQKKYLLWSVISPVVILVACIAGLALYIVISDPPAPEPTDFGDYRSHPDYPVRITGIEEIRDEVIIEEDVPVVARDGTRLSARVFRPAAQGRYPVVLAITAYDKDLGPEGYPELLGNAIRADFDLGTFTVSPWTTWEGPDPAFWVPLGYAVVYIDSRGYFSSEGDAGLFSDQDGDDFYDAVEWAARQEWSNGSVGTNGVSYLAISQWVTATNRPPSLKAIIPWEGQSDAFREVLYHGGIPETAFTRFWFDKLGSGTENSPVPPGPLFRFAHKHPRLLERFQPDRDISLEEIEVPALIAATWSDQGLHTRGSFEGFKRISSDRKWLFNHGRQKWAVFYSDEALEYQRRFFDHFLKGEDNGWEEQSQVRFEVRENLYDYQVRYGEGWPLRGTDFRRLYLNPDSRELSVVPPAAAGSLSYESLSGKASFSMSFSEDTEIVGNMKLRLWVSTDSGRDMDLFVGVRKFDSNGDEVTFYGKLGYTKAPVSMGWLRVSERELDTELSTEWQPVLTHRRRQRIRPGDVYPVEIEILPSGTLFRAGETLRLDIQGTDLFDDHPKLAHDQQLNKGIHTIHSGGEYDSYLLVPFLK